LHIPLHPVWDHFGQLSRWHGHLFYFFFLLVAPFSAALVLAFLFDVDASSIILCKVDFWRMAEWRNGNGMAEWWNGGMVEWLNGYWMAEWRNGNGMTEWRNGRMAEWRSGGMAECWNGIMVKRSKIMAMAVGRRFILCSFGSIHRKL
jgi:hypothetical protein